MAQRSMAVVLKHDMGPIEIRVFPPKLRTLREIAHLELKASCGVLIVPL